MEALPPFELAVTPGRTAYGRNGPIGIYGRLTLFDIGGPAIILALLMPEGNDSIVSFGFGFTDPFTGRFQISIPIEGKGLPLGKYRVRVIAGPFAPPIIQDVPVEIEESRHVIGIIGAGSVPGSVKATIIYMNFSNEAYEWWLAAMATHADAPAVAEFVPFTPNLDIEFEIPDLATLERLGLPALPDIEPGMVSQRIPMLEQAFAGVVQLGPLDFTNIHGYISPVQKGRKLAAFEPLAPYRLSYPQKVGIPDGLGGYLSTVTGSTFLVWLATQKDISWSKLVLLSGDLRFIGIEARTVTIPSDAPVGGYFGLVVVAETYELIGSIHTFDGFWMAHLTPDVFRQLPTTIGATILAVDWVVV